MAADLVSALSGAASSVKGFFTARRTIALAAVLVVLLACLLSFWSLNGGSLDPTGREVRYIATGSMDGEEQPYEIESVPMHSVVMIEHVDATAENLTEVISVGDVIAFDHMGTYTVHRVVGFGDGGAYAIAHGDARPAIDTQNVQPEDIRGKVVGVSEWMGSVVHFVKSSPVLSVVLIAVLVVAAYCVYDIACIVRTRNRD